MVWQLQGLLTKKFTLSNSLLKWFRLDAEIWNGIHWNECLVIFILPETFNFWYHFDQSKEECDYLIKLATPQMVKSTVVDSKTGKSKDSRYVLLSVPSQPIGHGFFWVSRGYIISWYFFWHPRNASLQGPNKLWHVS